jgi:glycosyltransferase involved in cell wall biosynthesis
MKLGHSVLVIAASHHHIRSIPVQETDLNRPHEVDGINFLFLPARPYRTNTLGRYLNMRDFARGIDQLAESVRSGAVSAPDVIIASSAHILVYPPSHRVARKLGARIIFEVRDIWPLSLVQIAGVPSWHPAIAWMKRIESDAYRTADAVVSLLPNAKEHMQPRGLSPDRFHWIPNGVSADEWAEDPVPLPENLQAGIDRCREECKLVVVYTGAHGPPNALDQLLGLSRIKSTDVPYRFFLIGEGIQKDALRVEAGKRGMDCLRFFPSVSRSEARSAMRQADVCFIGWQDKPIYQYGISANKLFEYLMSGKPVLHAVSRSNDPVAIADAGISVPPYQPDKLDAALRTLAKMSPEDRRAMGERGRAFALQHHEWSVLGRRYGELCEKLAGSPGLTESAG